MKNKIPNESIFKKKGFYVALYSCLGVVMVLAAVVSFNNISKPPNAQQDKVAQATESVDMSQLEATVNNTAKYLTPADKETQNVVQDNPSTAVKPGNGKEAKPTITAAPTKSPAPNTETNKSKTPTSAPASTSIPTPTENPNVNPSAAPSNETSQTPAKQSPPEMTDSQQESQNVAARESENAPVFNKYDGKEKMIWPVLGEIVMDYSVDHVVYDKTLDQYRTNEYICISAELGSQISASAEGVVTKVEKTKEDGNTVVIDNGNGWTTTYTQLQDGVLVKEGDVVEAGKVIGGVSNPTIYSVLLGNHMAFRVEKDGVTVDPKTVLQK